MLKSIRENPERGFYCIDWADDNPYQIVGSEFDDNYTHLDIVLVPCNYMHTMLNYEGDYIRSECIGDLESQEKYVGASHMLMYVN